MRFAIVVLYVSALLAIPEPAFAQSGAQYLQWQRWCRSIGGTPSGTASNPVCIPPRGVSSGGGAATYGGSSGAAMGQAIGGVLGAFIREGLFGNPQQEAQRQQALAAQRQWEEQERQRLAAERARQEQERYDRLRSSLLDFNPGPQLSLMGQTSGGAGLQLMLGEDAERSTGPARAELPKVGGLQLMLGDSAEGNTGTALAELTRAAAWSSLAAQASTPEDAVMLADAAFQGLLGGKVNLPSPPPDVKGVPVGPLLPEIRPLKEQFLERRKAGEGAAGSVVAAEERVEYLAHLERRTREMERSAADAARRVQAKEAALQAQRLREQAQAELASAREALKNYQQRSNDAEQVLRAFLSSLAATRKPDSYFYLGFEDGSQCFSQNAGPRCDKARAPTADYQTCISSYRSGYSAGEKIKQALLEEANLRGQFDREAARAYSDTDTRAQGPCRYEYVMAYNRGYFSAGARLLAYAPSTSRTDVPLSQPAPHPAANKRSLALDISTVDTQNMALPKSVDDAIPRTDSGERVRKGFQAVQSGDWNAAHAWFQDALKTEPGNPGIQRLVELTEFTRNFRVQGNAQVVGSAQKPSARQTTQGDSRSSADNSAANTTGQATQSDNFTVRTSAVSIAARSRAEAAFREYTKKYGESDPLGRVKAVVRAARGEGFTDQELKEQLAKALVEARKLHEKNHPDGPPLSVNPGGGPSFVEEVVIGGKG